MFQQQMLMQARAPDAGKGLERNVSHFGLSPTPCCSARYCYCRTFTYYQYVQHHVTG